MNSDSSSPKKCFIKGTGMIQIAEMDISSKGCGVFPSKFINALHSEISRSEENS